MDKLSAQQIDVLLGKLSDWKIEGGELVRTFNFKDFRESLAFVNRVGELAEAAGHHPDIDIRYNRVKLGLVSHDAGGITARDAEAARRLSAGFDAPAK